MRGALLLLVLAAASSTHAIRAVRQRRPRPLDVAKAPLAVSLGEIMSKIQNREPLSDITQLVQDLERKIKHDQSLGEHSYNQFLATSCVYDGPNSAQQAKKDAEHERTLANQEITTLHTANVEHANCPPALQSDIKGLEERILELKANRSTINVTRHEEAAIAQERIVEIEASLTAIAEIRKFIQNSTLDDRYLASALLSTKDAEKNVESELGHSLELKAAEQTGSTKALYEQASSTFKR